jgi:hypothetical protein
MSFRRVSLGSVVPGRPVASLCAGLALSVSAMCVLPQQARAAIAGGETGNGEFFLVVWDPVKEASYTLDLGYRMDSLLVDGQKDEGFQKFWIIDKAADAQFQKLLNLGGNIGDMRWGVYAVDTLGFADISGLFIEPGDLRFFTTLEHTVPTGTLNPNYTTLSGSNNNDAIIAANSFDGSLVLGLNLEQANPDNTHGSEGPSEFNFNGRSFHTKGQSLYFDNVNGWPNLFVGGPPSTNAVGSSSWAYQVLNSSAEGADTVLFDEFDNLTHDGFWGFAQNPADGSFVLSYTIEGTGLSLAERSFVQAIGRTERNGGFDTRRLAGGAASPMELGNGFSRRLLDEPDRVAVSVVPEPASWALMGLGLGVVGWLARRRG